MDPISFALLGKEKDSLVAKNNFVQPCFKYGCYSFIGNYTWKKLWITFLYKWPIIIAGY